MGLIFYLGEARVCETDGKSLASKASLRHGLACAKPLFIFLLMVVYLLLTGGDLPSFGIVGFECRKSASMEPRGKLTEPYRNEALRGLHPLRPVLMIPTYKCQKL